MGVDERTPLAGLASTHDKDEGKFSSRAGVIASCLGCSIGPDNIWRFPRILAQCAGKNGALCFLLPWFLFLWVWSIPMLVIEYTTGRYTGHGVVTSMQRFMGNKSVWCGLWIALINFLIGGWYSVLMGWCMYYVYIITCFPLPVNAMESKEIFSNFALDSTWPVLTQALSLLLIGTLLLKGAKTIEKSNLVLVPVLLVFIATVFVWSMTREGALRGVVFMFTPDWGTLLDAKVWINAFTQDAFDCGAGWGKFLAYAALMDRSEPVIKYAVTIPIFNNIVSLTCGMLTFGTVFASLPPSTNGSVDNTLDLLQTSGPASTGITFIWLPMLFSSAGILGKVFASLFFFCLFVSTVSSLMATTENVVQVFVNYGLSRVYSVVLVVVCSFLMGLPSAIDVHYLANQDFTWAFALLVSGLFLQIMVMTYGVSKFRNTIINDMAVCDWVVPIIWEWIVKWLIPVQAVGLLMWWIIYTLIIEPPPWYALGTTNLLPVLLQWLACMLGVIMINVILVKLKPAWFLQFSPDDDMEKLVIGTENDDIDVAERPTYYQRIPDAEDNIVTNETKFGMDDSKPKEGNKLIRPD